MTIYDQNSGINDRKNMEYLLVHKLKKMLIFDQQILEVANQKLFIYKILVLNSQNCDWILFSARTP